MKEVKCIKGKLWEEFEILWVKHAQNIKLKNDRQKNDRQ